MSDSIKKVYIEPTNKCNFSCEMCFRNSWFDEKILDMPYEVFEKALDGIPLNVETILFGGMGEPMVHPRIFDMIVACKKKGYSVEMITNGSLLNDRALLKLLDGQLDKLWISLDSLMSADEVVKAGHPRTADILKNIQKLNQFRSARSYDKYTLELGIAFVVYPGNLHELKELPLFLDKYNINHVNISNMKPENAKDADKSLYSKTINMRLGSSKENFPTVNIPYMDFDREDVQDALGGLFANINFVPHIGNIPVPRRANYCRFVEEGMTFIRSDGNVSPCMELLHNGTTAIVNTDRKIYHHSFGSVLENSLEEIWNSQEYTAFREKVKAFSFSPCIHCGHCGESESNIEDCIGSSKPCCGACLWAEGLFSCP